MNVQIGMNLKNSKEAILNQALGIFSRLGFHKTTMADIASASNRGRRTIYTYFKSKEEVYEAVVERELDKVLDVIRLKLEEVEFADSKLEVYLETRLKSIIELTKFHEALRIAYSYNYKHVESIRQKLDIEGNTILKSILELGVQQNILIADDVDIVVETLSIIIRGIEFILIKEDKEQLTDLHIQSMQALILNGLTKKYPLNNKSCI